MGVLPCEDEEGVVGCARSGRCAPVFKVSPLAGVYVMAMKCVHFNVCDNSVFVVGVRVEFGKGGGNAIEIGEVRVVSPREGEHCRGVEVADRGGEAVFKVKVKQVVVKFNGADVGFEV